MNKEIIDEISQSENIMPKQIEAVLKLLSEGNTIPFIARYRKEATNNLNEEEIRKIEIVYTAKLNLLNKKNDVIRLIDEKGLLTEEIKNNILNATKLVEIEDIYRPFKEKKKTKATEALNNGLEPLAKMILSFPTNGDINSLCQKFINDKVKTIEKAVEGASYIIAEWISDNASYRKYIRSNIFKFGILIAKLKKDAVDEDSKYAMYYDYEEPIKSIKPHRILAINRGEKEKILTVSIKIDNKYILENLERKIIKNPNSFVCDIVKNSISDAYKRLIFPSVEREIRKELKEKAEEKAIENFSENLENLLLTPPIKEKVVLGFDPAYRTGCKLAVLDKMGNVLEIAVIYPTKPNEKIKESEEILLKLIDKYNIDVIAIGNGTASRESEKFVANTIKKANKKVEYVIVSEAGASVYSASSLAISEFPNLSVEKRSAISIGRRLQDALSELVKIDPKSIGVGLYQHDITSKALDESLNFVVLKTVNSIGVNLNTASASILSYISGLTKKVIKEIIDYRKDNKFKKREDLKKLKSVNEKIYEQSIGFLRIIDGENILDKTSIHPDYYDKVNKMLEDLQINLKDIGQENIKEKISNVNYEDYGLDKYTFSDIKKSLISPMWDPRDNLAAPILKSDILTIDDLKIGDTLQGTVRNVVDFGAFIDIGLHNDGLIHVSKISNNYIKDPKDILSVGQIVEVKVIDINKENERVSLSMIE